MEPSVPRFSMYIIKVRARDGEDWMDILVMEERKLDSRLEDLLKDRMETASNSGYLYRVITLEQFIDMLLGGSVSKTTKMINTLVRPWMWEDPYEKLFESYSSLVHPQGWFGQCWSLEEESDSIWRSFTNNGSKRCVKIKVSIENLKDSLLSYNRDNAQFVLAPVLYNCDELANSLIGKAAGIICSAKKIAYPQNVLLDIKQTLLLAKRNPFRSENEVRLLVYDESRKKDEKTWSYPFDVNRYVEEVVFDPWTKEYYRNNFIKQLSRIGLKEARKKVHFSELYDEIDLKEIIKQHN